MTQPRTLLTLLGIAGSAGLLLGALAFQHIGGLPPCKLCYWQRYGHVAAVILGLLALLVPQRILLWLAALGAGSSGAVGIYHTGVERGWWEGPSTCTSGPVAGKSVDALLNDIMAAPMVRCDDIAWELASLSMASWNVLASTVVALCFVAAANRLRG
ncbi:disulfide bond formation protein B [Ponticoccus sp. (in: a-proteobacteria)]|uniref:disulfide bond formation protein B n=1 Tax=Ponticoccus sp. (in: a-proteobacteria) TaxID=1925025 RepID=UPI003AB2A39A